MLISIKNNENNKNNKIHYNNNNNNNDDKISNKSFFLSYQYNGPCGGESLLQASVLLPSEYNNALSPPMQIEFKLFNKAIVSLLLTH